jgi:hypothetical protein
VINGGYTNATAGVPYTFVTSSPPPPKPQTALEWLDSEVERTCAFARLKPEPT